MSSSTLPPPLFGSPTHQEGASTSSLPLQPRPTHQEGSPLPPQGSIKSYGSLEVEKDEARLNVPMRGKEDILILFTPLVSSTFMTITGFEGTSWVVILCIAIYSFASCFKIYKGIFVYRKTMNTYLLDGCLLNLIILITLSGVYIYCQGDSKVDMFMKSTSMKVFVVIILTSFFVNVIIGLILLLAYSSGKTTADIESTAGSDPQQRRGTSVSLQSLQGTQAPPWANNLQTSIQASFQDVQKSLQDIKSILEQSSN